VSSRQFLALAAQVADDAFPNFDGFRAGLRGNGERVIDGCGSMGVVGVAEQLLALGFADECFLGLSDAAFQCLVSSLDRLAIIGWKEKHLALQFGQSGESLTEFGMRSREKVGALGGGLKFGNCALSFTEETFDHFFIESARRRRTGRVSVHTQLF
jgi:hypothetical protein